MFDIHEHRDTHFLKMISAEFAMLNIRVHLIDIFLRKTLSSSSNKL